MQSLFSRPRWLRGLVSGIFLLSSLIGPEKTGWSMEQVPPEDKSTFILTPNEVPVDEIINTNPDQSTPSPEVSSPPSTSSLTSDQFMALSEESPIIPASTESHPTETTSTSLVGESPKEQETPATPPATEEKGSVEESQPALVPVREFRVTTNGRVTYNVAGNGAPPVYRNVDVYLIRYEDGQRGRAYLLRWQLADGGTIGSCSLPATFNATIDLSRIRVDGAPIHTNTIGSSSSDPPGGGDAIWFWGVGPGAPEIRFSYTEVIQERAPDAAASTPSAPAAEEEEAPQNDQEQGTPPTETTPDPLEEPQPSTNGEEQTSARSEKNPTPTEAPAGGENPQPDISAGGVTESGTVPTETDLALTDGATTNLRVNALHQPFEVERLITTNGRVTYDGMPVDIFIDTTDGPTELCLRFQSAAGGTVGRWPNAVDENLIRVDGGPISSIITSRDARQDGSRMYVRFWMPMRRSIVFTSEAPAPVPVPISVGGEDNAPATETTENSATMPGDVALNPPATVAETETNETKSVAATERTEVRSDPFIATALSTSTENLAANPLEQTNEESSASLSTLPPAPRTVDVSVRQGSDGSVPDGADTNIGAQEAARASVGQALVAQSNINSTPPLRALSYSVTPTQPSGGQQNSPQIREQARSMADDPSGGANDPSRGTQTPPPNSSNPIPLAEDPSRGTQTEIVPGLSPADRGAIVDRLVQGLTHQEFREHVSGLRDRRLERLRDLFREEIAARQQRGQSQSTREIMRRLRMINRILGRRQRTSSGLSLVNESDPADRMLHT